MARFEPGCPGGWGKVRLPHPRLLPVATVGIGQGADFRISEVRGKDTSILRGRVSFLKFQERVFRR